MKLAPVVAIAFLAQTQAKSLLRKNGSPKVALEEEAEWFERLAQEVSSLSPGPTPGPPTSMPPPPTDNCNLNVAVEPECPVIECGWDRCRERPFRMEFRFSPLPCAGSILRRCPGQDPDSCTCIRNVTIGEEDWAAQNFECTDFGDGPLAASEYLIRATPETDPSIIYFEGELESGGRFNATDPNLEPVKANIFLDLYESINGTQGALLQQVRFQSSCAQQLYLLDVFGSFQLVEFESDSQIVGLGINPSVAFALTLEVESDILELETVALAIFSPDPSILLPQTESFDVNGTAIPPPFTATTDITLIPDEDFTIITTVTGVINGQECSDISSTIVNCPANVEPNLTRFATLAPTDP